jgi:REP-associated tyrosine transposase
MSKTAKLSNKLYFVTLTIVDWIDIFTRRIYYDFIIENLEYCQKNKGLEIYDYVIMTNHIHMICLSKEVPLSDILRDFKTFTSKELIKMIKNNSKESRKNWMLLSFKKAGTRNMRNKKNQVWQNNNYPTLLSNSFLIDQKSKYIHKNPVVAGFVSESYEYYYSSENPNSPLKVLEY